MSRPALRVAYLVSEYPALSHVFVEREVRALRAAGAEVSTFSVRPTGVAGLSEASRAEAEHTVALQGRPFLTTGRALLRASARRPWRGVRALATALCHGAAGARGRLWQLFYLAEALLLADEMDRRGLTHVHAHFANNSADIARLAARLGRRWTWSFSMHGPTEFADPAGYDLAAKVRSAAGVACISRFCRARLREIAGTVPEDRLPIVRMTVDPEAFRPVPKALPDSRSVRILFVGRLVPEKGPLDLAAAVAVLCEEGRDLLVRVAGAGPLSEDLTRRLAGDGTSRVVELLGPVGQERVAELHRWADLFVLPSYAEGLPVVLMEAMASGLPVVTTPVAGIPELVRDRENGLLVEPGDVVGLAKAIGELIDRPDLRERLATQARTDVIAEFAPAVNTDRMLAFLHHVQGRP